MAGFNKLCIALVAICLTSLTSAANANRIVNGDFEQGLDPNNGVVPLGWQFFGDGVNEVISLSSDTPSGVGNSADIDVDTVVGLAWLVQDVPLAGIPVGTELTFTASVKEVVPASPDDAWIAGQVWMLPNSDSGLILSSVALFYSAPNWTEQSTTIPVAAGAGIARVLFTPQNPSFLAGTGQYRIDDVSLVIPEPSTGLLFAMAAACLLHIRQK